MWWVPQKYHPQQTSRDHTLQEQRCLLDLLHHWVCTWYRHTPPSSPPLISYPSSLPPPPCLASSPSFLPLTSFPSLPQNHPHGICIRDTFLPTTSNITTHSVVTNIPHPHTPVTPMICHMNRIHKGHQKHFSTCMSSD